MMREACGATNCTMMDVGESYGATNCTMMEVGESYQ